MKLILTLYYYAYIANAMCQMWWRFISFSQKLWLTFL